MNRDELPKTEVRELSDGSRGLIRRRSYFASGEQIAVSADAVRRKRYAVYPTKNSQILDKGFCMGQKEHLLYQVYTWILTTERNWFIKLPARFFILLLRMNRSLKRYVKAEVKDEL